MYDIALFITFLRFVLLDVVVLCLRLCPSVSISLMPFYCAMIWSSPFVEYEQRLAELKIQVYQRIRSSVGNMS